MADISEICNVQITLNSTGINKYGFNTLLILGNEVVATSRVLTYYSASAMVSDGFSTDDDLYIAASEAFSQNPRPSYLLIGQIKEGETASEALAAIALENNDWYGLATIDRTSATIQEVAAWAEANNKLFGYSTSDTAVIDATSTTDVAYLLKENNYYRTFGFYHANASTDYPEIATFAKCFAIKPGGETWAFKKLAGVSTDSLTSTQYTAATNKNINTFEKFRDSVSITRNGLTAAGEYIDVIRFRDWLQEEIQTNIFTLLINRDKVPYTDGGIADVEAKLTEALELGQTRGGIAPTEYDEDGEEIPGFEVTVPLAANISSNTKASRILEDVSFVARLAGAIHVVNITGSLSYEL